MKRIISIILFLLLASNAMAATVTERKVIASEYGWLGEHLGIGQSLLKITYSDGTVSYQVGKTSFLQPATITYLQPTVNIAVNVNPPSVPFTVIGDVSPKMGGADTLNYKYELYKGSCGDELRQTFNIPMSYQQTVQSSFAGAPFTAPGTYNYCLQEQIQMVSVSPPIWARGNSKALVVTVMGNAPGGTPTPTATQPPLMGSGFIKVTSNVPASVDIDNNPAGTTGTTFTVTVGGHDVRVYQAGYTSFSSHVTADYGATAIVDAYLSVSSAQTPAPTDTVTGTATATGTPTATATSSVDVTYGAGGGGTTYRGVDIRYDSSGAYYVGDVPFDSTAAAQQAIDDMIAAKAQKQPSIFDQINTPTGWIVGLIIFIVVVYVALPDKPKKSMRLRRLIKK